jgi:hypothetical protein
VEFKQFLSDLKASLFKKNPTNLVETKKIFGLIRSFCHILVLFLVMFGNLSQVSVHAQTVTGFKDCGYQGVTQGSTGQVVVKCLRSIVTFVFVLAIFISAIQIAASALGAYNPLESNVDIQKDFQRKITNLVLGIVLMGMPIAILNLFNPATTNFSTILDLSAINKRIASNQKQSGNKTPSGDSTDTGGSGGGGSTVKPIKNGGSGTTSRDNGDNKGGDETSGSGSDSDSINSSNKTNNSSNSSNNTNSTTSSSSLNSSQTQLWTEKILTDLLKDELPEGITKTKIQTEINRNLGSNSTLKPNDLIDYVAKILDCLAEQENCKDNLTKSEAEKRLQNLNLDKNEARGLLIFNKNLEDLGNIISDGSGNDNLDSYSGSSDNLLSSNSSFDASKKPPPAGEITGIWPKVYTLVTNQDFVKTSLDDSGCQVLYFQSQELDKQSNSVISTAPIETYSIKVCYDKNSDNPNNLGPKSPNDWTNFKDFIKRNPDGSFEIYAVNNIKASSFNVQKGVLYRHSSKFNPLDSLQQQNFSSQNNQQSTTNNSSQSQNNVYIPNGPVVMFGGTN